jgi:hypothetical protein
VIEVDEVECGKYKAIECMHAKGGAPLNHRLMAELLGPTILAAPSCQIILVSIMSKTFYELPKHPNVQ